jgi:hypothetical protein
MSSSTLLLLVFCVCAFQATAMNQPVESLLSLDLSSEMRKKYLAGLQALRVKTVRTRRCWVARFVGRLFVAAVWFGLVWFGLVWFGLVWFGLVWFGSLIPTVTQVGDMRTYKFASWAKAILELAPSEIKFLKK